MKMNFDNEELTKVIEMYSKASGQKFVIDPVVRGRISILIQEPISMEEAFNQLSTALAINGFAISRQGDTMVIRSARNVQRDLIEVSSDLPTAKPERMYTWVYSAKNVPAGEINRDLRILPSKDGEMSVVESTNQIFLTDFTSNIQRVALIFKEVDRKVDAPTAKLVEAGRKLRASRSQEPRGKPHFSSQDNRESVSSFQKPTPPTPPVPPEKPGK